jgi:hypothetical protein
MTVERTRQSAQCPAEAQAGLPAAVLVTRVLHGVVSVLFLACIAIVYVGVWQGRASPLTIAALAALALEGVLVVLSRGNCPLGPLFRRAGDETPLFELVLPPRAAKLAVPVLGLITAVGALVLGIRTLA